MLLQKLNNKQQMKLLKLQTQPLLPSLNKQRKLLKLPKRKNYKMT
jgi:hypothetical protein